MIYKKTMKIAMGVGMVLCASASFAERTESFEAALDGSIWFGDITDALVAGAPTAPAVGYPIADANHIQVLNVEGSVICSNETTTAATSATSSISDFLIFIPEPSDELGGEDEDLTGAKVAIAAGTNIVAATGMVPLCLYCTTNGTYKGWGEIGSVSTGTWVRVTLAFTNGFCRVSIDGEPAKGSFGYTAASDSASREGAWYKLAESGNSVRSLSFIGCAKLDDVVIKDAFEEIIFPADVSPTMANMPGETVNYNDLNKWGVTAAELNTYYNQSYPNGNTSGMTVAEKLECGLDPTSNTKFEPKEVIGKSANVATIKFPCDDPSKTGRYSVHAEGASASLGPVTVENGIATADVTFSNAGKVVTFWLVAEKE